MDIVNERASEDTKAFYERVGTHARSPEEMSPREWDGERRRYEVIAAAALGHGGGRVLDVGVGDGHLLERLAHAGVDALAGVDLAQSRLDRVSRHVTAATSMELRQGSAEKLPFGDREFDTVTCSEVLEHLVDPAVAVREAWRVLRPGGTYVVTVPHNERIRWDVCPHCGESSPRAGHLHSFDDAALADLMEGVGFVAEQCRGTYALINLDRWVGPLLRALPAGVWLRFDRAAGERGKGKWLVCIARKPL